MFYRYEIEGYDEKQGLLTLIPFMEQQPLTMTERKDLNSADMLLEKFLPYPLTENGEDVYAVNRGRATKAWFTAEGEKRFHDACMTLMNLARKYLAEFEYKPPKQIRKRKLDGEIIYQDKYQIIVAEA